MIPPWSYAADDFLLVRLSGLHATRYLQARLTADVNSMQVGESRAAAILSPQGKVEGVFQVWLESNASFLLWAEGLSETERSKVITDLLRFKVSEIVDIQDLSSNFSCVLLPATALAELDFTPQHQALLPGGQQVILFSPDLRLEMQHLRSLTADEYHYVRLLSERLLYPLEIRQDRLILEIPCEPYISRSKGCYAGQEVVEKVSALGRTPYIVKRFHDEKLVSVNEPVLNSAAKQVGEVLSSFQRPHWVTPLTHEGSDTKSYPGSVGVVRLKNMSDLSDLTVSGVSLTIF